jgi:hypothetical protein
VQAKAQHGSSSALVLPLATWAPSGGQGVSHQPRLWRPGERRQLVARRAHARRHTGTRKYRPVRPWAREGGRRLGARWVAHRHRQQGSDHSSAGGACSCVAAACILTCRRRAGPHSAHELTRCGREYRPGARRTDAARPPARLGSASQGRRQGELGAYCCEVWRFVA